MQWFENLLKQEEAEFNPERLMEAFRKELPKHTVPKEVYAAAKEKGEQSARALEESERQKSELEAAAAQLKQENETLRQERRITGVRPFEGGGLPAVSQGDFRKMGYRERLRLFEEDPEQYQTLIKGE